jgi:hypothetical protein
MVETTWYQTFFNSDYKILISNTELDKFKNILKNHENQHSVQAKVSIIESEYVDKLTEIEKLCNDEKQIEEFKKENSLKLLQKELDVIKLLTKYSLQNNQINYKFFISVLQLLLVFSETLRVRLGQKNIDIDKKNYNDDKISRCSYKFCNYKDSCNYNYNKSKNMCYQDHYVHNMVSADLKILIEYIQQKNEHQKNKEILKTEILKTINTLSFVINHMENELKVKCMYLPENEIELNHFIKFK